VTLRLIAWIEVIFRLRVDSSTTGIPGVIESRIGYENLQAKPRSIFGFNNAIDDKFYPSDTASIT
jgi:hypothetical protein